MEDWEFLRILTEASPRGAALARNLTAEVASDSRIDLVMRDPELLRAVRWRVGLAIEAAVAEASQQGSRARAEW